MKKLLLLLGVISLTSCDFINEEILAPKEFDSITKYADESPELMEYLYDFIELGAENGHDYSYVLDQPIELVYADIKGSVSARSWAINRSKIVIHVDHEKHHSRGWDKEGYYNRKILFHELAHDILNLKHRMGTPLMKTGTLVFSERAVDSITVIAMHFAKATNRNSAKGVPAPDVNEVECEFD